MNLTHFYFLWCTSSKNRQHTQRLKTVQCTLSVKFIMWEFFCLYLQRFKELVHVSTASAFCGFQVKVTLEKPLSGKKIL